MTTPPLHSCIPWPQGAYIATALVLVQQPEVRLAAFRKRLDKSIGNKHEEVCVCVCVVGGEGGRMGVLRVCV